VRKRSNEINKYSPKSPFISLAERVQQFLEKTPDRFKSKLVTMKVGMIWDEINLIVIIKLNIAKLKNFLVVYIELCLSSYKSKISILTH
jgi:hypothetical protein